MVVEKLILGILIIGFQFSAFAQTDDPCTTALNKVTGLSSKSQQPGMTKFEPFSQVSLGQVNPFNPPPLEKTKVVDMRVLPKSGYGRGKDRWILVIGSADSAGRFGVMSPSGQPRNYSLNLNLRGTVAGFEGAIQTLEDGSVAVTSFSRESDPNGELYDVPRIAIISPDGKNSIAALIPTLPNQGSLVVPTAGQGVDSHGSPYYAYSQGTWSKDNPILIVYSNASSKGHPTVAQIMPESSFIPQALSQSPSGLKNGKLLLPFSEFSIIADLNGIEPQKAFGWGVTSAPVIFENSVALLRDKQLKDPPGTPHGLQFYDSNGIALGQIIIDPDQSIPGLAKLGESFLIAPVVRDTSLSRKSVGKILLLDEKGKSHGVFRPLTQLNGFASKDLESQRIYPPVSLLDGSVVVPVRNNYQGLNGPSILLSYYFFDRFNPSPRPSNVITLPIETKDAFKMNLLSRAMIIPLQENRILLQYSASGGVVGLVVSIPEFKVLRRYIFPDSDKIMGVVRADTDPNDNKNQYILYSEGPSPKFSKIKIP